MSEERYDDPRTYDEPATNEFEWREDCLKARAEIRDLRARNKQLEYAIVDSAKIGAVARLIESNKKLATQNEGLNTALAGEAQECHRLRDRWIQAVCTIDFLMKDQANLGDLCKALVKLNLLSADLVPTYGTNQSETVGVRRLKV